MTKVEELEKVISEIAPYAITGKLMSIMSHQFMQPISALSANIQDLEDAYQSDELDFTYLKNSTKHGMFQINELTKSVSLVKGLNSSELSSKLLSENIREIFNEQINLLELSFNISLKELNKKYISSDMQTTILAILLNLKEVFSNVPTSKDDCFITIVSKNKEIILKTSKNITKELKNYDKLPFNETFLDELFKKLDVSIEGNDEEFMIIFNY